MSKKELTKGEQAVEDNGGDWKCASAKIWQPQPGDYIVGVYDGSSPVPDSIKMHMKDGAMDREITQHFIKVDGQRYSMIGGQVFDSTIADNPIKVGTMVRIEFLGQRNTKNNNRVNDFDVKYKD